MGASTCGAVHCLQMPGQCVVKSMGTKHVGFRQPQWDVRPCHYHCGGDSTVEWILVMAAGLLAGAAYCNAVHDGAAASCRLVGATQ
jgi:hypothetical protein